MDDTAPTYFADIEGLRLFAYQDMGWWSAAIYDLNRHEYIKKIEPLPPNQDSEEDAKTEALLQAAAYLGKPPDELESPVWQTGGPSPPSPQK